MWIPNFEDRQAFRHKSVVTWAGGTAGRLSRIIKIQLRPPNSSSSPRKVHEICTHEAKELRWTSCQNAGVYVDHRRSPNVSVPVLKTVVYWDVTTYCFLNGQQHFVPQYLGHKKLLPRLYCPEGTGSKFLRSSLHIHCRMNVCNFIHTNCLYPTYTLRVCLQIS
jgi:hypothetical protein